MAEDNVILKKIKKLELKLTEARKKLQEDKVKEEKNTFTELSKKVTSELGNSKTLTSWKFFLDRIQNISYGKHMDIQDAEKQQCLRMITDYCEKGHLLNIDWNVEVCRIVFKNPKIKTAKDFIPNHLIVVIKYHIGIYDDIDIGSIKLPYIDFCNYFPDSVSQALPSNIVPQYFYLTPEDQAKVLKTLTLKDAFTTIHARCFTEKDLKVLQEDDPKWEEKIAIEDEQAFNLFSVIDFLGPEFQQKTKEMSNFQKDTSFKILLVFLQSHVSEVLHLFFAKTKEDHFINNIYMDHILENISNKNEHGKRERQNN
jgi:hypothetical protein